MKDKEEKSIMMHSDIAARMCKVNHTALVSITIIEWRQFLW